MSADTTGRPTEEAAGSEQAFEEDLPQGQTPAMSETNSLLSGTHSQVSSNASSPEPSPAGLGGPGLRQARPKPGQRPSKGNSRSVPASQQPASQQQRQRDAERVNSVFSKYADEAELVSASKLRQLLHDLHVAYDERLLIEALGSSNLSNKLLKLEDVLAIVMMLTQSEAAKTAPPKIAFKRFLSQSRTYLETGFVTADDAVLTYMIKLYEHKRKCEQAGKFGEAMAATKRWVYRCTPARCTHARAPTSRLPLRDASAAGLLAGSDCQHKFDACRVD